MSSIHSGLYNLLVADPSIVPLIAANGVHFAVLAKNAALPALVLNEIVPVATVTFDNTGELIEGRFQFDVYADDQLTARKVAKAARLLLQDYSGTLYDGTWVQAAVLNSPERDMPYELGGTGYVYRAMFDLTLLYQET